MVTAGQTSRRGEPWPNLRRLLLAVGFLGLAIGILVARQVPATGYELSIYGSTPGEFWYTVALALAVSAVVCAINPHDRIALIAIGLGSLAIVSVGSLPLVRNYRFLGSTDALTHLGFVNDLRDAAMDPVDLLYPGGHSAAVVLAEGFGLPTERAMLFWAILLLSLYLAFVPLVARAILPRRSVFVIAAYAAMLVLPVNNVATVYQFHAYSLGVLLVPLFGFILFRYLRSERPGGFLGADAWLLLLIGVGTMMVFVHPQLSINLVIVLGTFTIVGALTRRRGDGSLAAIRPTLGAFVAVGLAWITWSFQHWQAIAAIENIIGATYLTLFGEQEAGQAAAAAGISASALGASLLELFVKIFMVSALFAILSTIAIALAMAGSLRGRSRPDHAVLTYAGIAGIVLVPFFLLHFLGDISQYFFRHLGFATVFLTVFGAIGVHYVVDDVLGGGSPSLRVVGIWCFAALLILSVPVLYASPYIYLPSAHMSHGELDGYDTAIEIRDPDVDWSGIRSGPGRFFDATSPGERPPDIGGHSTTNGSDLRAMLDAPPDEPVYLPISTRDVQRETGAYQELQYDVDSIEAARTEPGVDHVYSNGDLELYLLASDD